MSNEAFPHPVYKDTVLAPLFKASQDHFAEGLAAVNQAHAVMLCECDILTRPQAAALLTALAGIERERAATGPLPYTGAVEDYFFHVEARLAAELGADLAGRLHTGRSRNDIDHTLFRMNLAARLDGLIDRLLVLTDRLIDTAGRERATPVVAFTHGQPAQPSTWGHLLGAFIETLLRAERRLREAADTVSCCPMGAAAITTTGFAIDRARMAELLGFSHALRNSYGCIAATDYTAAAYAAIKLLFLEVGRFVQLLDHWVRFETGLLQVPDGFVQISSIMPQKRNPVPIEHVRLGASLAMGRADTVLTALHNTQFADMNDSESEVQVAGYAAFDSGERCLDLLAALLPACRINGAAVADLIDRSCLTLTELADSLVRLEGLSFRQAHGVAATVNKEVQAAGGRLGRIGFEAFRTAFVGTVGRPPWMGREGFARAISVENFIAVRDRHGGPAPAAMAEALGAYRTDWQGAAEALEARRARRRLGQAERAARVAELMGEP